MNHSGMLASVNPTVVVLIFTHKPDLNWHEEISLRQCQKVLGHHPIRLVGPEGLDPTALLRIGPSLIPEFVPRRWLASIEAYNRFKVNPWLYNRYRRFDYILTHELDAFVFRDELLDWCREGWDYIGAPWFEGWENAKPDSPFIGVGNSGLSLRRTATCRGISQSLKWVRRFLPDRISRSDRFRNLVPPSHFRDLLELSKKTDLHEDDFWATEVPRVFPEFKVAPYDRARRFSLEVNARAILNGKHAELPFGCHAWHRCDTEFWRPMIESAGHTWPAAMVEKSYGQN